MVERTKSKLPSDLHAHMRMHTHTRCDRVLTAWQLLTKDDWTKAAALLLILFLCGFH